MQAIKDQVKSESRWDKSDEYAENIASVIAENAEKELHKLRATNSGADNLYNKTKAVLIDRGYMPEMAQIAAQYAVDKLSKKMYPAKI
jgi:hypothetical protein